MRPMTPSTGNNPASIFLMSRSRLDLHQVFSWIGSSPRLPKFWVVRKTMKSDGALRLVTLIAAFTSECCTFVNHNDRYIHVYPTVIATSIQARLDANRETITYTILCTLASIYKRYYDDIRKESQ